MENNRVCILPVSLLGVALMVGTILANTSVQADIIAAANAAVIVPSSCNFTGTVDTPHTAEIPASQYKANIGKTTFNVTCNDSGGFAIYTVGYSGAEFGNNKLLATIDGTLNPTYDIATGTATSGSTSNWAMKLTAVSGTYTPTIENSYNAYKGVPNIYTKVASFGSVTDSTNGASVEATYAAYIAGDQPAGTYNGKVRYTMVHPASETPAQPQTTQSGKICYYANASDAVGTMGCQDVATSVTILASNFSRTGYGFAGWSDTYDYESNADASFYGPQETITLTPADYQSPNNGLSLYAVWIKSIGHLQDTAKVATLCDAVTGSLITAPTDGTANLTSVSALTDQRDNQTYAIAKLADGKCWMIENLRLESTNSDNSTGSLSQGYGVSSTYGNFKGLADVESTNFSNSTAANSLYYSGTQSGTATIDIGTSGNPGYRMPRYNNINTSARASNPTTNSGAMYSYGNYYTWHAAVADLTYNRTNNQSVTGTSLCPGGWHLPTGGGAYASGSTGGVNATGDTSTFREFYNLGYKIMDEIKTAYEDTPNGFQSYYTINTNTGKTPSAAFRSYPNNFVYAGFVNTNDTISSRGSGGWWWPSTTNDDRLAYTLFLNEYTVYPGTIVSNKFRGWSIRCIASV